MKSYTERDRAVVWHPFTQVSSSAPPITIVRGEGVMLYDDQGNAYIDAVSSWWVNVHGHSHPHIARKVGEQLRTLEHVIFAGFTHPQAIEVSERVLALQPFGHGKVFFSDNGSTAVEVALKMALQYWWNKGEDRQLVMALDNGYHGDTVGAMSAGGRSTFNAPFESIMFEVAHLPVPDGHNNREVLEEMEARLQSQKIAAFLFEPMVQGAAGMVMYDVEGMKRMLALARKHGALLIADEVMTGFGRTGKLFASEHYGIAPDIMALSKALTGGTMPMAVTTCKDMIYEAFISSDMRKTFFHGHSFTGNPTACAAALASLDLVEDPAYMKNIRRIAARHQAFARTLSKYEVVRNLRTTGTILAFEVSTGSRDSYFNEIRDELYNRFMASGVLLRPLGNTVYIMPPFVITDQQLSRVYAVIEETLRHIRAELRA